MIRMTDRERGIEEIADILRGQHNQKRQKVKEYAAEVGMAITLPDEEEQDFRGMAERAIDAEIVRLAVKSLKERLSVSRLDGFMAGGSAAIEARQQAQRQQYDASLSLRNPLLQGGSKWGEKEIGLVARFGGKAAL